MQFPYHIFIVILLQNHYCFAIDLSVAKILLQNRIFLVVSNDSEFCLVGHQTIVGFEGWKLDSGCTYHMCPHKERFFNFEEVDGELFIWVVVMLVISLGWVQSG